MMWLAIGLFGIALFALGFMTCALLIAAGSDAARYHDAGDLS